MPEDYSQMRILFTGATSFTGYWFARELANAGHEVTAAIRMRPAKYGEGVRGWRAASLANFCHIVADCSFGDDRFVDIINRGSPWDVLCHHAAVAKDYRNPAFDAIGALAENANNIQTVSASLAEAGCKRVVLTGTLFEPNEGAGDDDLRAFSPYGLSKGITSQVFLYYALANGISLGKFVIPNPFGPHEEKRFTSYLASTWLAGGTPDVQTPNYVRDNIHVTLLARIYRLFVERVDNQPCYSKINPSGYVETQGAFARRCAFELSSRFGLPCLLNILKHEFFPEPRVRINTDSTTASEQDWSETRAWDDLADFYLQAHAR